MRRALLYLGILNDHDVEWLIASGSKQTIETAGYLIEEGKAVQFLFIVLDGKLSVSAGLLGGAEIARLRCGDVVGEMSFVDYTPPSASVRALEPSHVLAIPRVRLDEKLAADVHFGMRFYRAIAAFLSSRLRATVGQLGYSKGQSLAESEIYEDELDLDVLDKISLAGSRFDWLQRRLQSL